MKIIKVNFFAVLFKTLFGALLLTTSCVQQDNKTTNTIGVDKPKIDIQTAVVSGNIDAVKQKQHIEAGTNINEKEPLSGATPLISAATFNKIEIAKVLIDAGADLTIKNNDGSTPLHVAAFFCRIEIVQFLIDSKADKTLKNNFGATPRESVVGPFKDIKPIYEMLQQQLAPIGLKLDMNELEKNRPVIAMMLQ